MKLRRPSSGLTAYIIVSLLILGGVVSAILTTDSRWMEWHLSRLGEGGQLGAYVFNFTVGFCALLIGVFARSITNDVRELDIATDKKRLVGRLLQMALGVVSVGMIGVAAFPFDRFPLIHNFFGYGTTITFVVLIAVLPKLLPVFTRKFSVLTYIFIVILGILFGIYFATNQRGIPLIYIELLAVVYFFAWIIALVHGTKVAARS